MHRCHSESLLSVLTLEVEPAYESWIETQITLGLLLTGAFNFKLDVMWCLQLEYVSVFEPEWHLESFLVALYCDCLFVYRWMASDLVDKEFCLILVYICFFPIGRRAYAILLFYLKTAYRALDALVSAWRPVHGYSHLSDCYRSAFIDV